MGNIVFGNAEVLIRVYLQLELQLEIKRGLGISYGEGGNSTNTNELILFNVRKLLNPDSSGDFRSKIKFLF